MIAGAVSSIIIFQGFTHNMVLGLRETTVETQTGHLQLALRTFWNKSSKKPQGNLIHTYKDVVKEIEKDYRVKYAVGKIEFFSLVSLGDKSVSARVVTIDPKKESSRNRYYNFIKGHSLSPKKPFQIALGGGLAKRIGAKPKDTVSLLTHTYDGVVNAMDLEVSGIFSTDISEFDDTTMIIPLQTAQKLLDTKAVEQIIVGLRDTDLTDIVKTSLVKKIAKIDPNIYTKTWESVATLYNQVSTFNGIQTKVVQSILMALVLLSILNTVGMSIFERTGEIGTVRALGEKKKTVVAQFVFEGLVLGVVGSLAGILWGILSAQGFNLLHIPMVLPGASTPVYVKIDIVLEAIIHSGFLGIITTVIAALIPARRASQMNIVDALRHNI